LTIAAFNLHPQTIAESPTEAQDTSVTPGVVERNAVPIRIRGLFALQEIPTNARTKIQSVHRLGLRQDRQGYDRRSGQKGLLKAHCFSSSVTRINMIDAAIFA
jgi:hypothetical protein